MRGFTGVDGGSAVGAGPAMGVLDGTLLGTVPDGVTVVTVSGGSWELGDGLLDGGLSDVLGATVVPGVVEITDVLDAGGPMVAFVDALSPLLMMTAVAMAPTARIAPAITVGRQRRSVGHSDSP